MNCTDSFREKDYYREKIIELVEKIDNTEILKIICGFAISGYKEEKAGSE